LKNYLEQKEERYTEVLFVDDLDENIRTVKTHCPNTCCYRVDPQLHDKLVRRFTRRKSF